MATDGDVLAMMEAMRDLGYGVSLKIMPIERGFILDEAVSEFDAPRETTYSKPGQWACEAQWMADGPYQHDEWAIGPAAVDVVQKVHDACMEAKR